MKIVPEGSAIAFAPSAGALRKSRTQPPLGLSRQPERIEARLDRRHALGRYGRFREHRVVERALNLLAQASQRVVRQPIGRRFCEQRQTHHIARRHDRREQDERDAGTPPVALPIRDAARRDAVLVQKLAEGRRVEHLTRCAAHESDDARRRTNGVGDLDRTNRIATIDVAAENDEHVAVDVNLDVVCGGGPAVEVGGAHQKAMSKSKRSAVSSPTAATSRRQPPQTRQGCLAHERERAREIPRQTNLRERTIEAEREDQTQQVREQNPEEPHG
jgi:hypothetical protein